MTGSGLDRRSAILGAAALAGCQGRAATAPETGPLPPLKQISRLTVGCCAKTGDTSDPAWADLFASNFGQLTPEWEMKMEAIVGKAGALDFARADAIADFARDRGLRLHGHTLVWYAEHPPAFEALAGDAPKLRARMLDYVGEVAGRYRGRAASWDVVNEPVEAHGEGYRNCLWSQAFGGIGYVAESFRAARAADPDAVLFLNDYDLESRPKKRLAFLRLAESLLKSGAPLGGLGTQTHVSIDTPKGAIRTAVADLASLGLPVHVSELDVSTRGGALDPTPPPSARRRGCRRRARR